MNKLYLILISITTLALYSCRREGCTDSYALNYEENAKKNDFSCVYYSQAKITYVSCNGWSSTNLFGNPWDASDDPDTYIAIYLLDNMGQSISYESGIINNNSGSFVDFTVNMAAIDSLNQNIHIALEDEDGVFDSEMKGENINLWEYTNQGSFEHKYPSNITKGGFSINIEWIE